MIVHVTMSCTVERYVPGDEAMFAHALSILLGTGTTGDKRAA